MGIRGRKAARDACGEQLGQSTVEYALVLVAFLAAIVALGAVWHVVGAGGLQRLSEGCASHAIEGVAAAGGMHDIVLF